MTRLWIVVLIANLAGALLFALAISQPSAVDPGVHEAFRKIGYESVRHEPYAAFIRGIFGGWIIALMVWLMPSSDAAKVWIIILLTWLLGASGLTHIIAGSIDVLYLVVTREVAWQTYVMRFGLPTLAGNTIGGLVFVAILNRAHATR